MGVVSRSMSILHTLLAATTLLLCTFAAPVLDSVGTASNPAILRLSKKHVHSPPRSRVQALLTGNGSSIPANGAVWPTAIYWTKVQIGTPPVDFPVAIDSGSGDLDVSGKGCKGCVTTQPNVAYDHTKSSTSRRAFPFAFSNTYQTCDLQDPTAACTISGPLFKDAVSLAGLGPVEVTVGSIGYQTGNFDQFKEIDGVMGFTMGTSKNVFASLVAAGKADNVWAMCMYEGQVSNGTITIGGVDPRLSDDVKYVDDTQFQGFHSVEVASLQLGTTTIPVGKAAILDTGTNVLLAPKSVISGLSKAMCADSSLAHCADLWSNQCVDLTDAEVAAYPALSMSVGQGVTLHMSSQDYLLRGSPLAKVAGQYCIGIRDGGDAGGGFIIGDTTMRNYYLVFDLAEKKIGWGKVNKDMCGSI